MYKNEIKDFLSKREDLREALFAKGYLITSDNQLDDQVFPFYGLWNKHEVFRKKDEKLIIYIHPKQKFEQLSNSDVTLIMIGNAINPFDKLIDEKKILKKLSEKHGISYDAFNDYLNELTGVFALIILNKDTMKFRVYQDASGMKAVFYSFKNGHTYVSSHAQLIADLLNLKMDKKIAKLLNKKFYSFTNRYLPGNLSPYKEIKRIGGNTYLHFDNENYTINRFYPIKALDITSDEIKINNIVDKISELLVTTMKLVPQKWHSPAISLTGGTDSKTTLAVANGLYNKYSVFSYISKNQEEVDANAAKKICDKLKIEHTTYRINENNSDFEDFDILKKIIDHNTSYFKKTSDNEIRKLIYFYRKKDFDVEVKSWASETVRVFLDRKYGMSMPKTLNERHFSILQSRYIFAPKLLKYADLSNKKYLKEINLEKPLYNYEHADLYYWEFRMGAWGSSVVNSFDLCHDVIMPINNRKIIELFLQIPREFRIDDGIHNQIIETNNPLMKSTEHIENLYFHNYRKRIEKVFFKIRTTFYRSK